MKVIKITLAMGNADPIEGWRAYVNEEGDGLAVCREPLRAYYHGIIGAAWEITHIASGRSIARFFELRQDALDFAKVIKGLCDWSRQPEAFTRAEVERLSAEVKRLRNESQKSS